MFVRGIGEYLSQERGDLLDPVTGQQVYTCSGSDCAASVGSDRHDFSVEGLLAYEASPGTVFFLGYTRQFRDTAGQRGAREPCRKGEGKNPVSHFATLPNLSRTGGRHFRLNALRGGFLRQEGQFSNCERWPRIGDFFEICSERNHNSTTFEE